MVSLSTVLLGWLRHDRQQAVATDGQEHFSESFFFSTWSNAQLCRKVQMVSRACSRTARSRRKKVEEPCRSYRLTDEHTESGACTTFTATRWLPNRTHVCRSRKVLCGIRSISSYYVFLMLYDSAMETMITERAIATIDVCLSWGRVPCPRIGMPSIDRSGG